MANNTWIDEATRIRTRLAELNKITAQIDAMAAANRALLLSYDAQAEVLRKVAGRTMGE
jgi:hypothetical protein